MRISDWSSDVCSSDLANAALTLGATTQGTLALPGDRMRYCFTLAEDALLLFDSLTNNGSLNWTLTGPSGVIDGRNFNNSDAYQRDDATPFFAAAGAYVLTVAGNGQAKNGRAHV